MAIVLGVNGQQGGIYAIRHIASGKMYVGSSEDIENRWSRHRKHLKRGDHHSRHLQRAWDKYGPDAFAWEILEIVADPEDLIPTEQRFLDTLGTYWRTKGYNISFTALATPMRGRRHTRESCAKISASLKGREGKPCPPETRAKMSAAHSKLMPRVSLTSKYKGVCWFKRHGQWYARICKHGRSHFLGFFDLEIDAAVAYDYAARRYHGEFAQTNAANFPEVAAHAVSEEELLRRHIDRPRGNSGEANHAVKLSADQIREMRSRFAEGGITYADLSRIYGVCDHYVSKIIRRKAWRHIQ